MSEAAAINIKSQEQLKALILTIVNEDDSFAQQLNFALKSKKKRTTKPKKMEAEEGDVPFSEMPFWKLYPDFQTIDAQPYRISKEAMKSIQKEWSDMPPAEEIIAQLSK